MLLAYPLICWGSIACQRLRNLGPQTSRFDFGVHLHDVFPQIFSFHQISIISDIYFIWNFFIFKYRNFELNLIFSSDHENEAKELVFKLLQRLKSILSRFRAQKMVCKTYSLQFATFWNFQHQKSTDFGFRSRCQHIAIILRELLRKRKKPCKECVLASEILYIYFMHRKVTFFLFFCSHLAAEKSTFQRILLIQGSHFWCQLCNRCLNFFRWQRWTTQKSRKTCILTGEILDIYLSCSKLLDFIPFFLS